MVLHLQNFDIIRIVVPQRTQSHQHSGKHSLNGVLLVAGRGEGQGDAVIFPILDPDLGLGAAHIVDGGFGHGNDSGDGGADNVLSRLVIIAVTRDGESGDPLALGVKFASCHKLQSDLGDLHLGVRLAMTDVLLLVLLGLVADDVDLLALAVLDDLGLDAGTLHSGSTDLGVLAVQNSQNLIELDGSLGFRTHLFHEPDLALGYGVLLTTGHDNCFPLFHLL